MCTDLERCTHKKIKMAGGGMIYTTEAVFERGGVQFGGVQCLREQTLLIG